MLKKHIKLKIRKNQKLNIKRDNEQNRSLKEENLVLSSDQLDSSKFKSIHLINNYNRCRLQREHAVLHKTGKMKTENENEQKKFNPKFH